MSLPVSLNDTSSKPSVPDYAVPILIAQGLSKSFGDRSVVRHVSFSLRSGEILGLLGPNGAGKTTTVGMLYGAVEPTQGFVQVGNLSVQQDGRQVRTKMGIVTQDDNLDPDFTVLENLLHFAHHYRIVGKAARQRAEELLIQANLQAFAKSRVDKLSGGMQRKLVLARALLHRPQIIFLDEPTTGLDPEARQEFWKFVIQLKQQGCGILLTTHYMDEAQRLCDRLLLLQQGEFIDQGTPAELIERTVGYEVAEIEGVSETKMALLADQTDTWGRSFGNGYLVALPRGNPEPLWNQLVAIQAPSLMRRRANLEDVFLRLTGRSLK